MSKGYLHVNGWKIQGRECGDSAEVVCGSEADDGISAADAAVEDLVAKIHRLKLTAAQKEKVRRSVE